MEASNKLLIYNITIKLGKVLTSQIVTNLTIKFIGK